jgi:hypothetical protein
METFKRARRRKLETAKTDLKPLLDVTPEGRVSTVRWNPKMQSALTGAVKTEIPAEGWAQPKGDCGVPPDVLHLDRSLGKKAINGAGVQVFTLFANCP